MYIKDLSTNCLFLLTSGTEPGKHTWFQRKKKKTTVTTKVYNPDSRSKFTHENHEIH